MTQRLATTDIAVNRSGLGVPSAEAEPCALQPRSLSPELAARVAAPLAQVAAARRRLYLQTFVARLIPVAAVALAALALWACLGRLAVLGPDQDAPSFAAIAALAALGVLAAAWQRRPWLAVAAELDARASGQDRLATALELAARGRRDAWAQVQAAGATAWARRLDVPRLFPWRWPARLPWLALAAIACGLAFAAPLPGRGIGPDAAITTGLALHWPSSQVSLQAAADLLGQDAMELLQVDVEVLNDIEAQVHDEPTRRWISGVRAVLQDVQGGAIDRRDALSRLAALEAARPEAPERQADPAATQSAGGKDEPSAGSSNGEPGSDANAEAQKAAEAERSREQAAAAERDRDKAVQKVVSDALKEALTAAPAGGDKEEMKKAADKGDIGALAKLVEKLADREMSDKELEGWVKTAEKLAKQLGIKSVPKEFNDLAEKVRRLEQKRASQGGLDAADQRRLHNARRALEQLRRDQGDVAGAQSTLQRLERGAKAAADEMRRDQQERGRLARPGEGGEAGKAGREQQRQALKQEIQKQLQRASDELRRESQGQQDRQARRVADGRIRDLRDALQRSSQSRQQGQGFERRAAGKGDSDGKSGERGEKSGSKGGSREEAESAARQRQLERKGQGEQGAPGGKGEREREEAKSRAEALGDDGLGERKQGAGELAEGKRPGGKGQPGAAGREGGKAGQRQGASKFRLGGGSLDDDSRMAKLGEQAPSVAGTGGQRGGDAQGDDNLGVGEARKAGGARTEKVAGAHGDGPSIKRTFVDTARRGFAKTGWADVYGDYKDVAQEMLDKESLPPGRRALVRRYYELIRPR